MWKSLKASTAQVSQTLRIYYLTKNELQLKSICTSTFVEIWTKWDAVRVDMDTDTDMRIQTPLRELASNQSTSHSTWSMHMPARVRQQSTSLSWSWLQKLTGGSLTRRLH